jgi:hypothetical protein
MLFAPWQAAMTGIVIAQTPSYHRKNGYQSLPITTGKRPVPILKDK